MRADVTTLESAKAGEIDLADRIFGLEPRPDILHRMVRYQLLKRMAGTHHAQDRSEVTVTGKKLEGPAVPSKAAVKAAADGSLKLQLPKNSKLVPLKQVQIEK